VLRKLAPKRKTDEGSVLPNRHLLLVDDDDALRTALAEVLQDEQWDVATARNGQDALTQLRATLEAGEPLPCAILLDLMMPVMDGFTFRAEQTRDERLAHLPVIVLTAGTIDDRVRRLGVKVTMRKPIDLESLFAALGELC
jgi:CheY-like chemotaxis protein